MSGELGDPLATPLNAGARQCRPQHNSSFLLGTQILHVSIADTRQRHEQSSRPSYRAELQQLNTARRPFSQPHPIVRTLGAAAVV